MSHDRDSKQVNILVRFRPCFGKYIRQICNFGLHDLAMLRKKSERGSFLVANKFNLEVNVRAPYCHWSYLRGEGKDNSKAEDDRSK